MRAAGKGQSKKKEKKREGDQGGRELNEMLAPVQCRRSRPRLFSSSLPSSVAVQRPLHITDLGPYLPHLPSQETGTMIGVSLLLSHPLQTWILFPFIQ